MKRVARRIAPSRSHDPRVRTLRVGVVFAVVSVVVLTLLWQKPKIMMALAGGDKVVAEFASSYRLTEHDSTVKVAGLEVGQVTDIRYTDKGTAQVSMKVDHDVLKTLGSTPTARIEPRTLLGGRYVVEITPGGRGSFDRHIPLSRTADPVELDRVLEAFPASTRSALQGLVEKGAPTLENSTAALGELLQTAPKVLEPGTAVVQGLAGENPDRDLEALVTNLSATADVLTRRDGQLEAIVRDLHTTAGVLADHRVALRQTVHDLPQTIRAAHEGITGLDDSVVKLRTAADALEPSAPRLREVVERLQPLLVEARPLMANLRPLLDTARPTVRRLVPVAERATSVLDDLHGPVLDRVNGPVTRFVLNPWSGTGPYAGAPMGYMKDHPFYQELAYMAANVDRGSMTQDQYGSTLAFQVGAGLDSAWLGGTPFDLTHLVKLALDTSGIKDRATRKRALKNAGVIR